MAKKGVKKDGDILHEAIGTSTNENSPASQNIIPRVVIRHRIKGAKKAQKRLRKNGE
jgi:hypothetical protein